MSHAHTTTARPAKDPKDTLGCVSSKLLKDVQFDGDDIRFYRKCMEAAQLDRIAMPACERGFLIGVSLAAGHRRKIFRGARAVDRRFEAGSIYIRDFSEDYRADLYGGFDFVLVELPRAFLMRLADEQGVADIAGLTCAMHQKDRVLGHLAQTLAPGLEAPGPLGKLFIEEVGLAIGTHLARQYGNARVAHVMPDPHTPLKPMKGGLSAAAEARAKEMLMQASQAGASISDIARECDLSRAYFIRAFAKTTGRTPHQWLLEQRTAQARNLIEATGLPLSDIAAICGFADQSHLSRVFQKTVGMSPGAWRRSGAPPGGAPRAQSRPASESIPRDQDTGPHAD
ncbi:helix-turn-helix transcriptional regulator [Paraburkholderia kururiensis]|uniref:AraC family transcriptional regulator n=1 Tax=Paraburkholderia kururiensis TaxID=984307 RepID=A0ABZ0WPH6_9BURK|nr:AraC family transcriptional regulator [Paraburkholderia kururiensis]WQD79258.1 AraC family transcriptional regulator [Paraburkholderia kururiensis]